MFKKTTIRGFVAGFMLLTFAFSVTPTIFLHNWLATHKDSSSKASANGQPQVGKLLFNCHCDNIVATSPFIEPDTHFRLPAVLAFSIKQEIRLAHIFSSQHFFFSRRGPPVV